MNERLVPLNLDNLVDRERELKLPLLLELRVTEDPPPRALQNLDRMAKLGILNADALLALVAQAPIDPLNLMGTLMRLLPGGWVFSAIDFSMIHVLAKAADKAPLAAMHVDLLAGNVIKFLAQNQAKQLVLYKEFLVEPSEDTWNNIQGLMAETVAAAQREANAPKGAS